MTRSIAAALLCLLLMGASSVLPTLAGSTERVSVDSVGGQIAGLSYPIGISADGRFVAFGAVAGIGSQVVYLRDRLLETTEPVSLADTGDLPNADCWGGAISADGRFVVFHSPATNLVPGDTNDAEDVFVRDRLLNATERVSVSTTGEQGNGHSHTARVSADGRFVAFLSHASNLVSGDTNGQCDTFVHDRLTGIAERVSVSTAGGQGNAEFGWPAISADGRFVAFSDSGTSNLVPGDHNACDDVFVRDRLGGTTELVSVSSTGEQGDADSFYGAISGDGRYVAFGSQSYTLVPGESNAGYDIFVRDRLLGLTERASVSSTGGQSDCNSVYTGCIPAISADGRYVTFPSYATNLVPGGTNGDRHLFLHDRVSGMTELVAVSSTGEQENGVSGIWIGSRLSDDGRFVVFDSTATNLVPDDTNNATDVFVRDREGFSDVPFSHWAFKQISSCVHAGIVQGYSDGTYRPDYVVARDQMAVYISRALAGGDVNVPTGPAQPTFSDVLADHWAYKYIEYCVANYIVVGYAVDNTYRPGEKVNRGQMAAYVARAIYSPRGIPPDDLPGYVPPADPRFPDVNTDHPFYKYVEYIAGVGVVQGFGDGTYRPTTIVNRGQMAVYVARAFALPM